MNRTPDHDMTVRGSIAFPTVYSTGSTIDDNAASGQKVVPVTATTNFTAGDRVIIGRGTAREEEFVIDSVSDSVSITSKTELTYNHTVDADTTVDAENADEPGVADSEFLDADNWTDDDWTGTWGDTELTHSTGTVEEVTLSAAGSGYEAEDELSLTQSENTTCKITVGTVDAEGAILTYAVTTKGSGYTIASDLSGAGGTGTGAKFDILDINNESPLSHDHTPTIGKRYYIALTVATRTDGAFTLSFGGITSEPIHETTAIKMYAVTADPVVITPSKTFDGTITISIKEITKILTVTATDDFVVGETVIVNEGENDEETYVIASIQAGTSLTMTESLKRTHDAAETVVQTGTEDTLEVCMASLSNVIDKAHYKDIVLFLPSTWVTAAITFKACDTPDGTFNDVVVADDVGDVSVASVAASKVITMNGEIRDALTALPYIKLQSGTTASPVDQGTGSPEINYVLTR